MRALRGRFLAAGAVFDLTDWEVLGVKNDY